MNKDIATFFTCHLQYLYVIFRTLAISQHLQQKFPDVAPPIPSSEWTILAIYVIRILIKQFDILESSSSILAFRFGKRSS